jgi:hypothetical protein
LGTDLQALGGAKSGGPHKLTEARRCLTGTFRRDLLSLLVLAALWFGLCRELSGEWSVNEQYNFAGSFLVRALPFLAPLAGPAAGTNFKSQIASRAVGTARQKEAARAAASERGSQ